MLRLHWIGKRKGCQSSFECSFGCDRTPIYRGENCINIQSVVAR